jgi:hypothetical protein
MMKMILLSATALTAFAATSAGAANLAVNGDFANIGNAYVETTGSGADDILQGGTAIPGWTSAGGPTSIGNDMWVNPANSYGLTASPGNGSGFFVDLTGQANALPYGELEQSITTVVGHQYELSFDLGSDSVYNGGGFDPATLTVFMGAVSDVYGLTATGRNQWTNDFIGYTATSTLTTFGFIGDSTQPSEYIGLDNVVVTDLTVPEPATWSMMLVGFGGMGAAMRMTRRKTAAATA